MAAAPAEFRLRPYRPEDCAALTQLCRNTVQTVNRSDYSAAEIAAWISGITPEAWAPTLAAHDTWIAETPDTIVGFADLADGGYLDRLYVHKDFQGRGVATALCDCLEARTTASAVTVHASITSLPFFLRRGYRLIRPNEVVRCGITLRNFLLEKSLSRPSSL